MVNSERFKLFIPLILSLILALFLFYLVQDFMRSVIIGPLMYVLWFMSLIVESIPQGVIWIGFILIILIFSLINLKKRDPEKHPVYLQSTHNLGQVEKWARLLDHAQNNRFTKWRLANELKRLTKKLLSPSDIEKDPQIDDPELPGEIIAFFEAQQPTRMPFWEWLNNMKDDESETALDLDPEIVIHYLEKRLRP